MAQLMPLPLTVSCFIKIQIGSDTGSPGNLRQSAEGSKVDVYVCVCYSLQSRWSGDRLVEVNLSGETVKYVKILAFASS